MRNPFRRKALTATPEVVEAAAARTLSPYLRLGGSNINTERISSVYVQAQSASYGHMYRTQPAVRSVVDYIARNVAQLGLKLYERVSDDEREHAGDHPAARAVRNPTASTPGQQFVFSLLADFLVYDNAYVLKLRTSDNSRLALLNIPPSAVGVLGNRRFTAEGYRLYRADGTYFDVPADDVIHWRGYDPEDPRVGWSKLETLRQELAADATARQAKTELDRAGLIPRGWIQRPLEAPEWTKEGREGFMESWANWSRSSTRRTPVLEEGMEFKQSSVSPEDAQLLESRKFTKAEVAAIYGMTNVPAQTEEERRHFYADVLPPYCEMLCAYLDMGLLSVEYGADDHYFEFNLDEKQMSDDRIKTLVNAAGGPILKRNESRARLSLPPVKDGDDLITPGNVVVGGKPSVGTMPIQDPNKPSQDGDFREDKALVKAEDYERIPQLLPRRRTELERQHRNIDLAQSVIERHFNRLERSLRSKAGKADWQRWDREFTDDLFNVVDTIVDKEGTIYAFKLGGDFDMRRVQRYLRAMSEGAAVAINDKLREEIAEIGLEEALNRKAQHVESAGAGLGAGATRWAREEAARQAPGTEERVKVWIANTQRHEEFNGMQARLGDPWPAGFAPGGAPGCRCSMEIV